MIKPYFGITSAVTTQEIRLLLVVLFEKNHFTIEGPHIPMIGILISRQTIDLGVNTGSRWYPDSLDIPTLLESTENKTFNAIHFNTNRPEALHNDISRILSLENNYDRDYSHGVQFNVTWPPAVEIDAIKSDYPKLKHILQLSKRAIEGLNTEEIVERVKTYSNLDYLLIDPSCGNLTMTAMMPSIISMFQITRP